nr:cupredoxin domain-containing protein [Porphyrobacter sp.]
MRPSTILAAALVAASPALAQTVNWGAAEAVTVQLSSFAYTPATVRLRAGQPVRLTLVNASSGG